MDQHIAGTGRFELVEAATDDAELWLREIQRELGGVCRHRALEALRGVLQAIRDQLTLEETAHLAALLPTLVRGIYFESWRPIRAGARDHRLPTFLERIRGSLAGFADDFELYTMARAVFCVLQAHISMAEAERLRTILPKAICVIWEC